ncbi:hypothetical protein ACIBEK_05675 [Nocardia fusca]|uniref:hypothetical protein n=1 Tax=Nocardia fusca TaxID=941183 RepID=UPI0037B918CD
MEVIVEAQKKLRGYIPLEPSSDHPEWEAKTGGVRISEPEARMLVTAEHSTR